MSTNNDDFLASLRNPWFSVAAKIMQSEAYDPITREEVASTLENFPEAPIPPMVRGLISQVLREKYRFKKGIRARSFRERQEAVSFFLSIQESVEKNPKTSERKQKRGDASQREQILDLVSTLYSITTRTLENWIKEHEKITLEAHKRGGQQFKSLREALTFERGQYARALYRTSLEGWPLPPLK